MKPKGRQGFASMDRAIVRAIASKGGHAAHRKGVAHRWTKETARIAGIKGAAQSVIVRQQRAAAVNE